MGYNPSISALNLNFNRVFFEWERTGEDYTVRMDARSDNHSPSVTVSRMTVEARDYPVYTFHRSAAWDEWTVARSALGKWRGRWLPVRRPPDYLAEVFQMLARDRGIALGTPVISENAPPGCAGGRRIREPTAGGHPARHDALVDEPHRRGRGAVGHAGGGVRPTTLAESGDAMAMWMRERLGARQARFVDHSGLRVDSKLRPHDMTRALVAAGPNGMLRGLMRDIPVLNDAGNRMPDSPLEVVAKTGTLNFVLDVWRDMSGRPTGAASRSRCSAPISSAARA